MGQWLSIPFVLLELWDLYWSLKGEKKGRNYLEMTFCKIVPVFTIP